MSMAARNMPCVRRYAAVVRCRVAVAVTGYRCSVLGRCMMIQHIICMMETRMNVGRRTLDDWRIIMDYKMYSHGPVMV